MLFFLPTLLPLVLLGTFAAGEHHHNHVRQYSRIPEQTITYEQLSGAPDNRVIELAPSNNVLHVHFDNSGLFGTRKSSVSAHQHRAESSEATVSANPDVSASVSESGTVGRPTGSFMRRTSYVKPEVYQPVVHQRQYSVPIYNSVPSSVYSPRINPFYSSTHSHVYSSPPRNAYPVPRTYYVPAQPVSHNPNMIRISPSTYQPIQNRNVDTPRPYTFLQPHYVRVHNPATMNNYPVVQNNVIRVPTIVSENDPKYTLITINSPIKTDVPPFQKVFPVETANENTDKIGTSAGMTGSQSFDRVSVPFTSRSTEETEPFVVRATSFSSKPRTEVRANIYRSAGGIIVHRLEENNRNKPHVKVDVKPSKPVIEELSERKNEGEILKPAPKVKVEIDQPTISLAVPNEEAKVDKQAIEPAKAEAKPVEIDVGLTARNEFSEKIHPEKAEAKKPEPNDEEILES